MSFIDASMISAVCGTALVSSCVGWGLNKYYAKRYRRHILRERKRSKQKELQYQAALEALVVGYTSAYICDLKTNEIIPFKNSPLFHSLVSHSINQDCLSSYAQWIKYCYDDIILPESAPDYLYDFAAENLMERMQSQDTYIVRVQARPENLLVQYFEIMVVRLYATEENYRVIIGYRAVDDLVKEEQAHNKYLQEQYTLLEQQRLETQKANFAKTNFLRRMSHDIRTPINGIIGITEIAERHPEDFHLQKDWCQKVRTASQYLLELVNNVLDMSKLESGEIKLERQEFDLLKVLSEASEIIKIHGIEKGISYNIDMENIIHKNVIGSPKHFQQVFMNIVGNAVKYNREGGRVDVICKEVSGNETSIEFAITCADTGCGMSEEFQKHLFEPFAQEHEGARTNYAGSGLGLAIAKNLIELQGGSISFTSKVGVGTTFYIRIPFEISHMEAAAREEIKLESIEGINILLVEDNELNMEIAEYLLKDKGAKVTKAWNGLEAINIFEKSAVGTFDIILMDVMMPVIGGLEATRRIRKSKHADGKTIPIIAMTANAFQDDEERSLKAGMNAHITKPLDLNQLIQTIVEVTR